MRNFAKKLRNANENFRETFRSLETLVQWRIQIFLRGEGNFNARSPKFVFFLRTPKHFLLTTWGKQDLIKKFSKIFFAVCLYTHNHIAYIPFV